jgi:hypothetical protein
MNGRFSFLIALEEEESIIKNVIIAMDTETDNGTGPNKGNVRWYGCSGIDCDEGWEHSFLPKK